MPKLTAPCRTREKRREEGIVQKRSLLVQGIIREWPRMVGLHGSRLGDDGRTVGASMEHFTCRLRHKDIHRSTTDVQTGSRIKIAMNLHEIIVLDCRHLVIRLIGCDIGKTSKIQDDQLSGKHRLQFSQHEVAPIRIYTSPLR